jgi:hypothetical protein
MRNERTGMAKKHDQPDELVKAAHLGYLATEHHGNIEVRKSGNSIYYLTGNTFLGRQTIKCRDAESALYVILEIFANSKKEFPKVKLPDGAELLPISK